MSTIRIAQEVPAVKVDTPRELIYRKPIVGGLVRATVLRDDGDTLKVQTDEYPYPRYIHISDVVSYVLATDAPAVEAPPSPKTAPSCDFAPETPVIMPPMDADPRFAYNVERAKLNELYSEWMSEREWRGDVLNAGFSDTPTQRDRLARYEARYRAQLAVVAAAKSKLTPAHLAWYQEEAHRLAAASFYRIHADEALIADEAVQP